jgi:exosortase N
MAILNFYTAKPFLPEPRVWKLSALVLIAAGCWALRDLFSYHLLTSLGLLLVPVFARTDRQWPSRRYLLPALLATALAFAAPVKTLVYFAWLFTLLLLVESRLGRLNYLPLFTGLVVSPIFSYLLNIFGFPLRLQLTQLAGRILGLSRETSVAGNIITYGGEAFSVDPACMGLNLSVAALLIGMVLLAGLEKRRHASLRGWWIGGALTLFFLLNVGANLARIVLLVFFRIAPETLMHDLTGLICLLVYVALPGYYLTRWRSNRIPADTLMPGVPTRRSMFPAAVTGILFLGLVGYAEHRHTYSPPVRAQQSETPDNFTVNYLSGDIIKLENPAALVYVKRIPAFYNTEHNPMVCWTGSGYTFHQVQTSRLNGQEIYEGQLVKGGDILYTAWWYSNGQHQTISQWDWRWRVFRGEQTFYLVNITAGSPQLLREEIAKIHESKALSGLIE